MRKSVLSLTTVILACLCLSAVASERNARLIDTIGVSYSDVNDADLLKLHLEGETALQPEGGPWAILLEGELGNFSGEADEDGDTWMVALGIKYYLFPVTSVTIKGTYSEISWLRSYHLVGLEAEMIHRLQPANDPVSPFVHGKVAVQERGRFSDPAEAGEDKSGVGFEVGGGFDFEANDELSFVVELSLIEGENLHGDLDISDGWRLYFGMKYYWE